MVPSIIERGQSSLLTRGFYEQPFDDGKAVLTQRSTQTMTPEGSNPHQTEINRRRGFLDKFIGIPHIDALNKVAVAPEQSLLQSEQAIADQLKVAESWYVDANGQKIAHISHTPDFALVTRNFVYTQRPKTEISAGKRETITEGITPIEITHMALLINSELNPKGLNLKFLDQIAGLQYSTLTATNSPFTEKQCLYLVSLNHMDLTNLRSIFAILSGNASLYTNKLTQLNRMHAATAWQDVPFSNTFVGSQHADLVRLLASMGSKKDVAWLTHFATLQQALAQLELEKNKILDKAPAAS